MSVSIYDPMNPSHIPGTHSVAIPRQQVGIERLPTRRASNEPREAMNCKSCRKRKIKCNRLRPSCEACQVFQCPCIYDAVPKKRGPKTDVLEALLKRVDGLEAKLREKNDEAVSPTVLSNSGEDTTDLSFANDDTAEPAAKRVASDGRASPASAGTAAYSPQTPINNEFVPNVAQAKVLLDTYFTCFHGKPFYILDEASIRQRFQMNQLPAYLSLAILAVSVRYKQSTETGQAATLLSDEYADLSRNEIDLYTPSIDALQALLLLVNAYMASGRSKKSYMLMTSATGMAMALELHRELLPQIQATPVERETRRRLFWSCYMLDRFLNAGSNRPCFINDNFIALKLPSWSPSPSSLPVEGEFFQSKLNLQLDSGNCHTSRGSSGSLIHIIRILGLANESTTNNMATDSHFSWHSPPGVANIRQELDLWASSADDVFINPDMLFAKPDSTILMLSKFIYHLIHILTHRQLLPMSLTELSAGGQPQSWQLEAINTCFVHANAIAELVNLASRNSSIQWPEFTAYCIFTAGTVHIHGVHYAKEDGDSSNRYGSSADYLSLEMRQLKVLTSRWTCVQHQLEMLQNIHHLHSETFTVSVTSTAQFNPSPQTREFFGRYTKIDGSRGQSAKLEVGNLSLHDVPHDSRTGAKAATQRKVVQNSQDPNRPNLKRKNTAPSSLKRPDVATYNSVELLPTPTLHTPGYPRRSFSYTTGMMPHSSPGLLVTPTSLPSHIEGQEEDHTFNGFQGHMAGAQLNKEPMMGSPAGGYGLRVKTRQSSGQRSSTLSGAPYTPPYSYIPSTTSIDNGTFSTTSLDGNYDTSFGVMATNAFNTPSAWYGKEIQSTLPSQNTPSTAVSSPSTRSNNESLGPAQDDGKDNFLSLLDHFSENEQGSQLNAPGNDLDFFS